jgi:hypothetical protein
MTKKSAIVLQWSGMEAPLYLARGLEMMGYDVILSERSDDNWRDHLIKEIVSENPPEWFFCPQRLYDPYDIEVITALGHSKTKLLVMDYGLIEHYENLLFDPAGENAEASISNGNFDQISKIPCQAKAIETELPRIRDWSSNLKKYAEDYTPNVELVQSAERGIAVFFAQRTGDMVLYYDSSNEFQEPREVARIFIEYAHKANLVPVIKLHPLDKDWSVELENGEEAVFVPNQFNEGLDAWLISNARAIVMVNSTLVFDCLALHAPVLQLGNGWCTGNELVCEGSMENLNYLELLADFDMDRRQRFLAMLFSRQRPAKALADPDVVHGLLDFFNDISVATINSADPYKNLMIEAGLATQCPFCTMPVEANWIFCGNCGHRLILSNECI